MGRLSALLVLMLPMLASVEAQTAPPPFVGTYTVAGSAAGGDYTGFVVVEQHGEIVWLHWELKGGEDAAGFGAQQGGIVSFLSHAGDNALAYGHYRWSDTDGAWRGIWAQTHVEKVFPEVLTPTTKTVNQLRQLMVPVRHASTHGEGR